MKYRWYHFSGIDWDAANKRNAIFKIVENGKDWSRSVTNELGNYDYLMFADVDFTHPEVRNDVKMWGEWIVKGMNLSGIRLDGIC